MKKILLFLSILFLSANCQETKNQKLEKSKEIPSKEVEKILIKQLKAGHGSEYWGFDEYVKQDLDALVSIEDTILKNHGYITPSDEEFQRKIKEIFGRTIDYSIPSDYLMVDLNDKNNKELGYYTNTQDGGMYLLYISKRKKLITLLYSLPNIIDFENIYPNSVKYDKDQKLEYFEGDTITVNNWRDNPNLKETRKQNIQILVHRNKYLFNDNKESFNWLKKNDSYFLKSLVETFGYTKDKELVRFVESEKD